VCACVFVCVRLRVRLHAGGVRGNQRADLEGHEFVLLALELVDETQPREQLLLPTELDDRELVEQRGVAGEVHVRVPHLHRIPRLLGQALVPLHTAHPHASMTHTATQDTRNTAHA
jgi:hypothetical protein